MLESGNPAELSGETIQSHLTTTFFGQNLHIFDEIPSTNITALELAGAGAPHGTVVLAECQTAGHGRLGRPWFSPPRHNLYCSIVIKTTPPPERLSWISLTTGLAIAQAIDSVYGKALSVKWPNDIMIQTKKVGGVLCDSTGQGGQSWTVVLGFGLNVNIHPQEFPPDLRDTATSLVAETGIQADRNHLIAAILSRLEALYENLCIAGLDEIRSAYVSLCSTLGRQVRVDLSSGRNLEGFALDINPDGSLKLLSTTHDPGDSSGHMMAIRSGDVVHVR